jgi:hypothetical protein
MSFDETDFPLYFETVFVGNGSPQHGAFENPAIISRQSPVI